MRRGNTASRSCEPAGRGGIQGRVQDQRPKQRRHAQLRGLQAGAGPGGTRAGPGGTSPRGHGVADPGPPPPGGAGVRQRTRASQEPWCL